MKECSCNKYGCVECRLRKLEQNDNKSASAMGLGARDDDRQRHPKCLGTYDEHNGDYSCDYQTILTCDECKYGVGRKDPAAKCNAA